MKITFFALLFSCSLFAQKEVKLSSDIEKVTVFFQGAQVEHRKSTDLKPGRQMVVFEKLTDFIDPNSVQVKATGDLTILSVRARKNYEDVRMTDAEIEELNRKKKVAEIREDGLRNEYAILENDKTLLLLNSDLKGQESGLKISELKEASTFIHQKMTEIVLRQTQLVRDIEAVVSEINKIEQEISVRISKPVINYTEIVVEIDVQNATPATFIFSYISPKAGWKPYYDLRSDGVGKPVKLEAKALVNQTTGIAWKNVNVVLSTNDPYESSTEPTLEPWFLRYNNYPQPKPTNTRQVPGYDYSGEKLRGEVIDAATGEPLPFTAITFPSNPLINAMTDFDGKFEITVPRGERTIQASYIGYAASQQSIQAPYIKFFLQPDEVTLESVVISQSISPIMEEAERSYSYSATQSISAEDIQRMPVRESRNKKSKYKDSDGRKGSESYAWSPTVGTAITQKDLRVEYAIQSVMSIPSDGVDERVQIATYELPANYEYHTVPKIDPSTYLVAQISGWEKLNLLSGESNLYFDGTYIGKSYLDANSTKDTLSFSLGKDNKIQVLRTKVEEKSKSKLVGPRRKLDVSWEIQVKNNGGAAIPILIKDQFPVSTDADIKVKHGDAPEGNINEKTGIITWTLSLMQGQSKKYTFDYSVDYQNGVVLYLE
jgi:hypothetical protein